MTDKDKKTWLQNYLDDNTYDSIVKTEARFGIECALKELYDRLSKTDFRDKEIVHNEIINMGVRF